MFACVIAVTVPQLLISSSTGVVPHGTAFYLHILPTRCSRLDPDPAQLSLDALAAPQTRTLRLYVAFTIVVVEVCSYRLSSYPFAVRAVRTDCLSAHVIRTST